MLSDFGIRLRRITSSPIEDAPVSYIHQDDYYVIGCAKGNTALRDLLNDTLEKLVNDGTAAQISEKWFGRDIVVFEPLEEE